MKTISGRSARLTRSIEGLTRRDFLTKFGTGLLVTVVFSPAFAQRSGNRQGGGSIAARIHIGSDGMITVFAGKVEMGQGARTELSQAASEELHVPLERISVILADTDLVPDDGLTAGSRSTPSTVPAVRRGAAAVRNLLL